jgi:effector-binding domain-containing protein
VFATETPAGRVATVVHWGAYDQMQTAYAALDAWCNEHGRPQSGVSWEVYGDWSADPAHLCTDIYYALTGS